MKTRAPAPRRGSPLPSLPSMQSLKEFRETVKADLIEIRDGLAANAAVLGRAERDRLQWVLAADRSELWRKEGCRNTAELLATTYNINTWKTKRLIACAYAIEKLPCISAALGSGALSIDKTVELTRFATPETEKKLVKWAKHVTTGAVRDRADREALEGRPEPEVVEKERRLEWWWSTEDVLYFEGSLAPVEGKAFIAAVDAAAKDLPVHPDLDNEDVAIGHKRADALVLLATTGGRRQQDPLVVLHAPLTALTDGEGNGEFVGGGVVPASVVAELCCNGTVEIELFGKDGSHAGIGKLTHDPPRWLRRAVLKRDSHRCAFPNCQMTRFLDVHHIIFWTPHGRTDPDNLITLCSFHHKMIHRYRWSVTLTPGGHPIWFRPGGRRYEPGVSIPDRAPPVERRPVYLAEVLKYMRPLAASL